jgi:hypothetical protein
MMASIVHSNIVVDIDKEAAKGVEKVYDTADKNVKEIEHKAGGSLFGFP